MSQSGSSIAVFFIQFFNIHPKSGAFALGQKGEIVPSRVGASPVQSEKKSKLQ